MEAEIKQWRAEYDKLKNEVIVNVDYHNTNRDSLESGNEQVTTIIENDQLNEQSDEECQYQNKIKERRSTIKKN